MSTHTMLDRYQTGVGYLARITHRLSGLLIAIYMLAYLWELNSVVHFDPALKQNINGFNATMAAYDTPFWRITHVLVVSLVVLHALTGLRVMLLESGLGIKIQKTSFWLSVVITLVLLVLLFIKMTSGLVG